MWNSARCWMAVPAWTWGPRRWTVCGNVLPWSQAPPATQMVRSIRLLQYLWLSTRRELVTHASAKMLSYVPALCKPAALRDGGHPLHSCEEARRPTQAPHWSLVGRAQFETITSTSHLMGSQLGGILYPRRAGQRCFCTWNFAGKEGKQVMTLKSLDSLFY